MKLNLGCGQNRMEGYVNVDRFPTCNPDFVADLEVVPWPFADNSADEIVMRHVLEHLGETTQGFFAVMKELYRVAAPGAPIRIAVPHPRSDGFSGDPTHVRPIDVAVLMLFSKEKNREWKERGWPNTPLGLYLDVDFAIQSVEYGLQPIWHERLRSGQMSQAELDFAVKSHFNVIDEIRVVMKAVK